MPSNRLNVRAISVFLLVVISIAMSARGEAHAVSSFERRQPAIGGERDHGSSMPAAKERKTTAGLLAKFKDSSGESEILSLTTSVGATIKNVNPYTGVHSLSLQRGTDEAGVLNTLKASPIVEWVEPNRRFHITSVPSDHIVPSDPRYGDQRSYLEAIAVPSVWDFQIGSPGVIIAVIDTGIMCSHPDLQTQMWRNFGETPNNGIDDDNNGYKDDIFGYDFVGAESGAPTDSDLSGDSNPCIIPNDPSIGNGLDDNGDGIADFGVSHGTHVAGVIAASTNNSDGIAGTCWRCRLIAVRVAEAEGGAWSSDLADGITYGAANGAKIVNISIGSPQESEAVKAAISIARDRFGAVILAAAGNGNVTPVQYPARDPKVIAIASSNKATTPGRALFSNGGGSNWGPEVDLAAPGTDIVTTHVCSRGDLGVLQGCSNIGDATYDVDEGTSVSAPLVSGIVGLMLSQNPSITPAEIEERLKATAEPLRDDPVDSPDAGPEWAGAGLTDAFRAVASVTSPTPISPADNITLNRLGTTLSWDNPPGTTQHHLQITPANGDGPEISLIRTTEVKYEIIEPVFGAGPYVMLPGMTYTWKVRASTKTSLAADNDPSWGVWSAPRRFKTPAPTSSTIVPFFPADRSSVSGPTVTLQWHNSSRNIFYYEVQVSRDPTFTTDPAAATSFVWHSLTHGGLSTPPNSYTTPPLPSAGVYFWRVRPRVQGDGTPVAWPPTWRFNVN